MNELWEPFKLSLRYKWTIAASLISSLMIAVLWAGNITAIYPFVEVVFQGDSLQEWYAVKLEKLEQKVVDIDNKLQTTDAGSIEAKKLETELAAQQALKGWMVRTEPFVRDYLPHTPLGTLGMVMCLVCMATLLKGVCLVINQLCINRITQRTVYDLQRIFYSKTLKLDVPYIESLGTDHLFTNLTRHTENVGRGIGTIYGKSVREPLKLFACLAFAAIICWRLLLISMIVVPIGFAIGYWISRSIKKGAKSEIHGMKALYRTLLETLQSIRIVKLFNRERTEKARFRANSMFIYKRMMRIGFFRSLMSPVSELLGMTSIAIALMVGAYLVLNNQTHLFGLKISEEPLTLGALLAFYGLLIGISDPVRKMSDLFTILIMAQVASRALYGTYREPAKITGPAEPHQAAPHCESLEFRDITFEYKPETPVLKQVNLKIRFGETVAFVGANGSGKSTLANLIPRFYDPKEGSILLDGIDLREFRPSHIRRQIALVSQETVLFKNTVMENIRYARPSATDEEVVAAAQIAGAHEFVSNLSEGYETNIGERGNQLSGGQRQRLALARAILRDPRILILDEATSQIDVESEDIILNSLRNYVRDRTTIMITHRISNLALADRIVVLENGRIVGEGTHQQLLSNCGVYRALFNTASAAA